MLTLTTHLKTWLQENSGLSADEASDDEYREAAATALVDGTLTGEKYVELSKDPDAEKANRFDDKLDKILAGQKAGTVQAAAPEPVKIAKTAPAIPGSEKSIENAIVISDAPSGEVNVIEPHKQYDTTRRELFGPKNTNGFAHPQEGKRLTQALGAGEDRLPIDETSELDKAINGVWFKYMLLCSKTRQDVAKLRMTEHDWGLLKYALGNYKWCGTIGGEWAEDNAIVVENRLLKSHEQKALLDDGTSDGLELAPIVFDADIIRTPTLSGQFFPRVKVVNLSRGRRVEGAVFPRVTGSSSGQGEGTNITLFTTASMIVAFDTTIFVWDGAIEVGLDFLSDSPVNVGGIIVEEYGRALMQWLDNQIINGDGTTEPEGVINDAGIGTASSANGAGGPHTVGDYEAMLLGIPFRFRQGSPTASIAFFGNETNYLRARGIAVGTTDARRVFGMDHESYSLLGHPFGIEENVGNANSGCVNFARYRMYRRSGLTIRQSSEGRTLMRSNLLMIVARARFGGQLEDGLAGILISDMQA